MNLSDSISRSKGHGIASPGSADGWGIGDLCDGGVGGGVVGGGVPCLACSRWRVVGTNCSGFG
jgi:hypothetical protein